MVSQIQNNWTYGEVLDENAKTHPMLRPYKTFSEKVTIPLLSEKFVFKWFVFFFSLFFFGPQDKEIYRWPIKESIKAMLAWEWTLEKARDGEGEVEKASTRKISQTAQVQDTAEKYVFMGVFTLKKRK